MYGDFGDSPDTDPGYRGSRAEFASAVKRIFEQLRNSGEYEYIIVDTRGGFNYETTEVCALADSFLIVTEAQYTSFYQDRNLAGRISQAAKRNGTRPLLRGFIVNKSTDPRDWSGEMNLEKIESDFRVTLTKEFPVDFQETYPIPLDVDAQIAYKSQKIPLRDAPGSYFSYALLDAFGQLLTIVTAAWTDDQADQWNVLVDSVSKATTERNREVEELQESRDQESRQRTELQERVSELERDKIAQESELAETRARFEREISRSDALLQQSASQESSDVVAAEYDPVSFRRSYLLLVRYLAPVLALVILVATIFAVYNIWFTDSPEAVFVACTVTPSVVVVGETAAIAINVSNLSGDPIRAADVRTTAPLGSLSKNFDLGVVTKSTDLDGRAEFEWSTPTQTFTGSTPVEFPILVSGENIEDGTGQCTAQLQGTP